MIYEVLRSRASDRDLEAIFDHLIAAYAALGDSRDAAFERAAARLRAIEDDMESLGRAPFQGTLRKDLLPGLRQVTKDRAIFYFVPDESACRVRVLAIFFGGQDHLTAMRRRMAADRRS